MNNSAWPQQTPPKWLILAVLLVILLAGAFLRTYRLSSLPPGLFMDEAMNGLDAQDMWRNGRFPIFFPANNGREPLYIYLQAALLALLGENSLNLRLASAYTGILTIPLVYVLGRRLFGNTAAALWIGVTAAAALATSYWHVSLSRLGFRTILLPFFVMLVLLWFWQGWQRRQWRWFVLGGVALGLSQYTYLAARAVPLIGVGIMGLLLLVLLLRRKAITPSDKMLLKGIVLMSAVALLIYLPLGIYLLTTPANAAARTADVSLLEQGQVASTGMALLRNVFLVGRMFVDRGDLNLRHNLPGRAALDWLTLAGFVTGLVLLLRYWRKPQSWLLASWLVVMLLPTLLSTDAPHYLRASGAVGAVMIIVGMGMVWWWARLENGLAEREWLKEPLLSLPKEPFRFWLLLPLLVLIISGSLTAFDYFGRWANHPALYDGFETLERQAGEAALQKLQEGTIYLIPDLPAQRSPALQFLLQFSDVRPLPSACLVFQAQAQMPVTYLVRTQRDKATLPQLQALVPGGEVETAVSHPVSGEIFFETYTIMPEENGGNGVKTAVVQFSVAQFGEAIQLTAADTQLVDDAIHITTTWQAIAQPAADHTRFIHLYRQGAEDGAPVAQLDVTPCYPTSQWQPGESLRETDILPLPPDLPPGAYTLALGWYTWPSFERLPLSENANSLPDHRYALGQISVGD